MFKKIAYSLYSLIFLFLAILLFLHFGYNWLQLNGVEVTVVFYANLLLFVLSVFGAILHGLGIKSNDPYDFYKFVMLATMLKLFVSAIAVVVYIFTVGKNKNVPAVYIGMGLYFLYTAIEVIFALRLSNSKQHA